MAAAWALGALAMVAVVPLASGGPVAGQVVPSEQGRVTISPNPDAIPLPTVGVPVGRSYTATNAGGPMSAEVVGGPLTAYQRLTPMIADLASQQRQISVPAGATSIDAAIGGWSDAGADLDLFLYDCATGTCVLRGQSATTAPWETISVANPAAGVWVTLVDAFQVPAGTTDFDYVDAITSPSYGTVEVTDTLAERAPGATWTVPATITVAADPAPRSLFGQTRVVDAEGGTIGRGLITMGGPALLATTTTLAATPAVTAPGEEVTLTATVAGTPGSSSRDVWFYDGPTYLGRATVIDGVATLTTTALTLGSHQLVADYRDPSTIYGSSASAPATHVVSSRPVADAGDDRRVDPLSTVTLDGSGSDPDGGTVTYAWTQTGGPSVVLTDPDTATPSFTAPIAGDVVELRLTVTEPHGLTTSDTVTLTSNTVPAADAGDDQTVRSGAAVTLDGRDSADPDTHTLDHSWIQTAGPAVTLTGATTTQPTFTAPAGPATLTFQLTVTDSLGASATDQVAITVDGVPTADAGDDDTVAEGSSVSLDATGSTDPEAGALDHSWTQISGTAVTLTGANTATPSFTAPTGPAALTFTLTVTDARGQTDTDDVTITVLAHPVADAGADQRVNPGDTVSLDGSASSVPGGGSLTYAWTQTDGPTVTLTGASTATPSFVAAGGAGGTTITLTLTVTGPGGLTDTDTVVIDVDGRPDADAGPHRTVDELSVVTLDGTGSSDPEGGTLTYEWSQTGGPTVTLDGADTATPTFTAPAGSASVHLLLEVTDPRGLTATDTLTIRVNALPTADAGDDVTVEGGSTVVLDGGDSFDTEAALDLEWEQDSGDPVTLTGADTVMPSFTAPTGPASLVFTLTVTDSDGATDEDSVIVTVVPPLTADEQWIVELYSTFLHRVPDEGGLDYWAARLGAGTTRAFVARHVVLSSEAARGPVLTDLFTRLLDRDPSAGDRTYWAGRLTAGTPYRYLERHLLASAERFAGSGGTVDAYVADLYQRVLGRAGGIDEIAYWAGRIESGEPRLSVVDALIRTTEALEARLDEIGHDVLGRPLTDDEVRTIGADFDATRDPRPVSIPLFLSRP